MEEDITIEIKSYVNFNLPSAKGYFDCRAFQDNLSLICKVLCDQLIGGFYVQVQSNDLNMEPEDFAEEILELWKAYWIDYDKKEAQKKSVTVKKLETFQNDGIRHQELLLEEFDDGVLKDLQVHVNEMLQDIEEEEDVSMQLMNYQDAELIMFLMNAFKVGDDDQVLKLANGLDTFVREGLPARVWDRIIIIQATKRMAGILRQE